MATPAYRARHGIPTHPADLQQQDCALSRAPFGMVVKRSLRRRPAGLPPVQPAERPDWWRKRVATSRPR